MGHLLIIAFYQFHYAHYQEETSEDELVYDLTPMLGHIKTEVRMVLVG
jgi:hypothetical protein